MTAPQPGVFAAAAPLQLALEFDALALDAAGLGAVRRAVGGGAVIALGARAYRRLGGAARTAPLADVPGVANTPRGLLVWAQDADRGALFDTARAAAP